ncbi:hypothetical protein EV424DRAFT_1537194 [Suillus variegatus]|nr:hypothetical protein EV424DRAFT_1537194 [Suillus variegatus]
MQIALIFTTLVTFVTLAVSHPTPKLVEEYTALAERQEVSSNPITSHLTVRLGMPDTPDKPDTPAKPDGPDGPDTPDFS